MERLPVTTEDGTVTAHFRDEEEGTHLVISITHEGLIMDAYSVDEDGNDAIVGTVGRMANEWWEYIEGG